MKHLRFLAVIAAVFTVITLAAGGGAAHASVSAPAVPAGATGYAYNGIVGIAAGVGADVSLGVYTTVSNSKAQIWINGSVTCTPIWGGGSITWRGYAGNGTSVLSTGCNYEKYGTDGVLHKYWLRYYLHAAGQCIVDGNFNGYYAGSCRY